MGVKYRTEFKGHTGLAWRVDISNDDYSGSIIELNSSPVPLVFRKDEDGIFQGISAEIGIEVSAAYPLGLTDLYASNSRTHKVQIYKQTNLIWSGYIVPEQYSDPLIAPPFDIQLRAIDGIGTLKNFDFPIAINGGLMRHIDIIQACLATLDLDLFTSTNISIEHSGKTGCILENIYTNCAAFYDDKGKPYKCDKVLSLLLNSYDPSIRVTQLNGTWYVYREADAQTSAVYIYDLEGDIYEIGGTITATSFESYKNFADNKCYPIGNLMREMWPAYRKVILNQDFGRLSNPYTPQGDIKTYDNYYAIQSWPYGTYHLYWHSSTGYLWLDTINQKYYNPDDPDQIIGSYHPSPTNLPNLTYIGTSEFFVANSAYQVVQTTDVIKFEIKCVPVTFNTSSLCVFRVKIKCGNYYLSNSGWTTVDSYLEYSLYSAIIGTTIKTETITAIAPGFPESGALDFSFGVQGFYMSIEEVKWDFAYEVSTGHVRTIQINSANISDEQINILGDVHNNPNSFRVYAGGFFLSDNTTTSLWKLPDDEDYTSLKVLLSRLIASDNSRPKQVYIGIIKGTSFLNLHSIIKDANNNNAMFRIQSGSLDIVSGEMSCTLVEMIPFTVPTYDVVNQPVYADASKSLVKLTGQNDYSVFGGSVGVGKRIYQQPTATSLSGKYILIDKDGNSEAEKYSVESLSAKPSFIVTDSVGATKYTLSYNATTGDLEIKNSSNVVIWRLSSAGLMAAKDDIQAFD